MKTLNGRRECCSHSGGDRLITAYSVQEFFRLQLNDATTIKDRHYHLVLRRIILLCASCSSSNSWDQQLGPLKAKLPKALPSFPPSLIQIKATTRCSCGQNYQATEMTHNYTGSCVIGENWTNEKVLKVASR